LLLITGLDESTGDRMQVECATASDRLAIGAMVVELKNLGAIAGQLCSGSAAPVLGPESLD
jgi:hypothetical protein